MAADGWGLRVGGSGQLPTAHSPQPTASSSGWCLLGFIVSLFTMVPVADADLVRGIMRVVGGVLVVPQSILAGTFGGPPIVGTISGVLLGVVQGVSMVTMGTLEVAVSAIPLAWKAVPLIPIFF